MHEQSRSQPSLGYYNPPPAPEMEFMQKCFSTWVASAKSEDALSLQQTPQRKQALLSTKKPSNTSDCRSLLTQTAFELIGERLYSLFIA